MCIVAAGGVVEMCSSIGAVGCHDLASVVDTSFLLLGPVGEVIPSLLDSRMSECRFYRSSV
jgi:hypothetical protein